MSEFPTPLHNLEAEKSFLGCFLIAKPKMLRVMADAARPEWFFYEPHRMTCSAFQFLIGRDGALDALLFKRYLETANRLDDVGGDEFIIGLAEAVPSLANWKHYLGIVRENWVRRELERRATGLLRDLRSDVDTSDLIAASQKLGENLSLTSPACPIGSVDLDTKAGGVTTGFESLDELVEARGFTNGQLAIIQADTNVGKSTLMIGCLVSAAMKNHRCLYATFADLDASQLGRRVIKHLSGWGTRPYANLEAQADYDAARLRIQNPDPFADMLEIDVYDAADQTAGYDIESFLSWLFEAHAEKPYAICFVDYAQELSTRDKSADSMVAQQKICASKITRAARALNIPFVVGSQVTITDKVSKTMYSRAWEQKAGMVIEIPNEQTHLWVKKNRFGPKNQQIPVAFNQTHVRFEEAA